MKYGVREICDVVLRAKSAMKVGSKQFYKNEPVLYFDSLTTSSLEGAATTVYAQGGRGNARLLAWEGERTLTFNMTDALISPESFAVLSGADVIDASEKAMYVHTTSRAKVGTGYAIEVPGLAMWSHNHNTLGTYFNEGADIFIMRVDGNEMSEPAIPFDQGVTHDATNNKTTIICKAFPIGSTVLVDYYTKETAGKQIEITPDKFGGYFYLEASTLWRNEETGKDDAAEFVIPRCKVQSNFTFTMAATGDPSTFDFVLDAFPDYSKFDSTKKVLAILQIVEDAEVEADAMRGHEETEREGYSSAVAFNHRTAYTAPTGTENTRGSDYALTTDKVASETQRTVTPS